MVFVCQLDWAKGCPDIQLNIIYAYVCEDASEGDGHLNLWAE